MQLKLGAARRGKQSFSGCLLWLLLLAI